MVLGADSGGVVVGVLLSACGLGEGASLGATLRSSSDEDGGAAACVVVDDADGGVVVLVDDPGATGSGAGAVVLVLDVGVVVGEVVG